MDRAPAVGGSGSTPAQLPRTKMIVEGGDSGVIYRGLHVAVARRRFVS
jgi:hypothetical protein